jgi:AraC-like DNA-binding protein
MQLVHRTLSHEGPNGARVAEVAKRYGFDGLGRFSGNYRELFGESPSSTLRRSLDPGMPHLVPGRLPVKLV